MLDEKTTELVAIGASITANCQPCLEYHVAKGREFGATTEEIMAAVETGRLVRRGATAKMDRYATPLVTGEKVMAPPAGCECQ
jgi:AhpD family alkylhydroperoxidase